MRIIFLGTGGYHPNERRHTSGVLLPEIGLLLDAGTGTFRAAERLTGDRLTIALTHAHLDHVCGLTYLLVPLHQGRIRQLRVLGAEPVLEAVRTQLFSSRIFPVLPQAEFIPLRDGESWELAPGATLSHLPLCCHPGGSQGFRVDWRDPQTQSPRSLAYITDTNVDGSYSAFIHGVDLLIHECFFPDGQSEWAEKTGHSCTSDVARLARQAQVGRLLLTHIDPQLPDDDPIGLAVAQAIFPNVGLAEDLLEVML